MPAYAPFFVGGAGLYLVHRDRRDAYGWGIVAAGFLIGQHYAVRELSNVSDPNAFAHRTSLGIVWVVALGFAAVGAIALGRPSRANRRWLTVAGTLTYPFYLVHEHLGWVAIRFLHRGLRVPSAVTFALTLVSMLLLALLLNRFVEKPLTPRLRRALSRV
jgi:peptidoglycan/LPS O-acetylase OafA/YrhL